MKSIFSKWDYSVTALKSLLAAKQIRSFGIEPKVAMVSHSNFGASDAKSALKLREALIKLHEIDPDLEVDGEMHADAALSEEIRNRLYPNSKLKGVANLLVMPNIDAANISVSLLKVLGGGVTVGPILMGMSKSAHVVAQAITVRNISEYECSCCRKGDAVIYQQ